VLSLGTLHSDALSAIFRSLPVSHDTLQMYANLKSVSRHILTLTRAQMKDKKLRNALEALWYTIPGTAIPYRAVTVAPADMVEDEDEFYMLFETAALSLKAVHGLLISDIFQCAAEFAFQSYEIQEEDDDIERFNFVVQFNYDMLDILHPSMVPENPGGMADLSKLPNVIRSSTGLTGLTLPYDSLVFGGLGDYYRVVQVTSNTTMIEIFETIAGMEGWYTTTFQMPFNMRLHTEELGQNVTVMQTMQMAQLMETQWVVVVDWPTLSTGFAAAGPVTLGGTTQLEVADDTVVALDDVEMNDVPPTQNENAALLYNAETNEWSYAQ